jgi:hypothetical protein
MISGRVLVPFSTRKYRNLDHRSNQSRGCSVTHHIRQDDVHARWFSARSASGDIMSSVSE